MVPPSSHRVSRVRRYSGFCSLTKNFIYRALTFFGRPSQTFQLSLVNAKCSPYPERIAPLGLASSAFARHYLRNLFSSSYLDVSVRMVPLIYLWIQYMMYGLDPIRIAPFGYLRINSCLPIPAAFRSLPRPSSAPDAKASFLRSY